MKQYVRKQNFLRVVAIALPVIMAGLIAIFYWVRKGVIPLPMPQWNDEAVYYEQVKMWLASGTSKGYWGFQGEHAILGTGGAWNPAILMPYVLWGKLFGWHYYSVALANIIFLCIANMLVLYLLRSLKVYRLILLEVLSGHLLLYSNTIMSEVLRYAFAIVLAGLLYRLLFSTHKIGLRYKVITGIYLLWLLQVYIFFAFAIPIYVFGLMKQSKVWKKCLVSFVTMAITAGGSYYLLHLISSNYNIFKTENLLKALQQRQVGTAIHTFLAMANAGLHDLINCMLSSTGHGMFHWFVPFVAALFLAPLIILIYDYVRLRRDVTDAQSQVKTQDLEESVADESKEEQKRDREILWIVSYSVLIFTGMYVTVYSLEAFTFYRGMGIVVLFSLVLLMMLSSRKKVLFFLLCYGIGLIFVPANMGDFNTERYVTTETRSQWNELEENLTQTMKLDTASDIQEEKRWHNTAVLYTMEPKLISAMPAGIGVNFMMYSDDIIEDAGYLVFSLRSADEVRSDWLEQPFAEIYEKYGEEIDQNFYVQYYDQNYIIYKHNP